MCGSYWYWLHAGFACFHLSSRQASINYFLISGLNIYVRYSTLGLHFHRSLCFCSDLGVPHRSEFFDSPLPLPESSSLCSWDWAYHVSLFTCDRKSCYFFRCMLLRTYLRYLKKKSWFFIFLCLWDKRWWILNKTGKGICSDICIYTCLWQECNDK